MNFQLNFAKSIQPETTNFESFLIAEGLESSDIDKKKVAMSVLRYSMKKPLL